MGRLLFVDDNIRSLDGHYFELATLLGEGATGLGYETRFATHVTFSANDAPQQYSPRFTGHRMLGWSLGVDGHSRVARDLTGRPVGGTRLQNLRQAWRDRCSAAPRRPQELIRRWATDLIQWLTEVNATSDDTLVINTGDDFQLLALASAVATLAGHDSAGQIAATGQTAAARLASNSTCNLPGEIHVILHFAIRQNNTPLDRLRQLGNQVHRALSQIAERHSGEVRTSLHLHATTEPLAAQLRAVGIAVDAVPYPTRQRQPVAFRATSPRLNLLLGGLPRREKGTKSISTFLSSLAASRTLVDRYRVSLQLPQRKWKRIVPRAMHAQCHLRPITSQGLAAESPTDLLNVITTTLDTADYQDWLDTADLGLFLYEPERYVARCSGVLLEMLIRGIPVLVPDRCWLADQVRTAGPAGTVGYVYRSLDEIPELLREIESDYVALRQRAKQYAGTLSARHHPTQTLLAMGIQPALRSIQAA